jgi:hypothetical protein
MTNRLNNLKQAASQIRLSQDEKAVLRAQILERVGTSSRAKAARAPRAAHWHLSLRYAVSFALMVMILVGSSTAYAAQGSLPGGALYPVKIYVNETVQGALAFSPEAKASFHVSVAQERLKEAEALASQGRLDATVTASLEQSVETHVEQAATIAQSLEEEDPASAVEAQVTLDSSLAAHSAILEQIGNESKDETTKENSNSIALKVRSRGVVAVADTLSLKTAAPAAQAEPVAFSATQATSENASTAAPTSGAASARGMAKIAPAASATPATSSVSQRKIAAQLQSKADDQLSETHDDYSSAKRSLAATTSAKISAQLSSLDNRMKQGESQLKNKDYDAARATFTGVIKDAVELSATIEASEQYNQDFVRSWRDNDGEVKGASTPDDRPSPQEGRDPGSGKGDSQKKDEDSSSVQIQLGL